jgi:putative aldose 1-epimerase
MLTIHNAHLKASISTLGAEMHALTVIDSGRSIIWHGDETFWRGHSPILFPLVGSAWNGTLRHEGREYHLPKHGIVRQREWHVVEHRSDSVTLAIENLPEDLEQFPWPFRLEVTYSLHHRTLHVDFNVKNLSTRSTMWFQIGGHPSIMLPTPLRAEGDQLTQEVNPFSLVPSPASVNNKPVGYLRFEGTPHSLLRASTQGCTEPQRVHIPWNKDAATSKALASNHHFNALVPLTIDTFAHEALIFDQHQVTAIHVLDAKEQRIARVVSSAPAWLVWAPTNLPSPFICCEPWYGLPDQQGFLGDWQDRPHVQHASPGTTWHGWYNIEV